MKGRDSAAKTLRAARSRQPDRVGVGFAKFLGVGIVILIVASLAFGAVVPTLIGNGERAPRTAQDPFGDDEIEAELRARIGQAPNDDAALAGLANVLAALGRGDEAIAFYERATRLAPTNTQYRLDFAATLRDIGRPADAEVQYWRVLELDSDDGGARLGLAELIEQNFPERLEEAKIEYRQLLELAPGSFYREEAERALERIDVDGGTPVSDAGAREGG